MAGFSGRVSHRTGLSRALSFAGNPASMSDISLLQESPQPSPGDFIAVSVS